MTLGSERAARLVSWRDLVDRLGATEDTISDDIHDAKVSADGERERVKLWPPFPFK